MRKLAILALMYVKWLWYLQHLENILLHWHSKNSLEGELHGFQIFLNNEIFVSQPAWPQKTTYCPNSWSYSLHILSQSKGYFHLYKPLLFRKCFLLCAIVITVLSSTMLAFLLHKSAKVFNASHRVRYM